MDISVNSDENLHGELLALLKNGNECLSSMIESQKKLHRCVFDKDWEGMQCCLDQFNSTSEKYYKNDAMLMNCFSSLGITEISSLFQFIRNVKDERLSKELMDEYSKLRTNLGKSKIENKMLSDYLRITNNFIQGVFDRVLPQRKNVLYSKNGTLVKNNPDSILINAVM